MNNWQLRLKDTGTGGTDWRIGSSSNVWSAGGGKFLISNTATSTAAAFAIDGQGRVGIGTIAPAYKLDVNGTINATGLYVNGVPFAGGGGSQWTTSGATITYNGGTVGIGTATAPPTSYKLAVGGKIVSEEVVVKLQANWPDYVFESNYKLPTLSELEKFIISNNHLPGVPTAIEVKENGLSLGEMNAILLRKIEELTLLMIKQQKELELLKSQNIKQQSEIDALR